MFSSKTIEFFFFLLYNFFHFIASHKTENAHKVTGTLRNETVAYCHIVNRVYKEKRADDMTIKHFYPSDHNDD